MLGKFRAYESLNASFFEGLVLSVLPSLYPQPVKYDLNGSIDIALDGPLAGVRAFGEAAASIFSRSKDSDSRRRLLASAVDKNFGSDAARELRGFGVVQAMSTIEQSEEWPGVVEWIVFSAWPGGGVGSNPNPRLVTYGQRFGPAPSTVDREFRLSDLLIVTGRLKAESVLQSEWERASSLYEEATALVPRVAVPGAGLSLPVDDLLMLVAPVLIFFQALYLVFWERQNAVRSKAAAGGRAESEYAVFGFPVFGCANDPLTRTPSSGLSESIQRSVYLVFLALPTLILLVGVLTRFDLVTPAENLDLGAAYLKQNYGGLGIGLLCARRGGDLLSRCLDLLCLGCLALSLLIITRITMETTTGSSGLGASNQKPSLIRRLVTSVPALGVLLLWAAWLHEPYGGQGFQKVAESWLFTLVGLTFAILLPYASRRNAKLVTNICILGIASYILLIL
jgi:hypothetical protein